MFVEALSCCFSSLNELLSSLLDLEVCFTIVLQLLPKRIDWEGVEQEQKYFDVVSAIEN